MENQPNQTVPPMPQNTELIIVQKPQKTWAIVLAIVVGLCLVAGGVWAYQTYFMISPELRIKQAFEKTAQANFAYEGVVAATTSRESAYDQYINLAMPVASDTTTKNFVLTFGGAQENIGKENEAWSFSFLATSPDEKGFAVGLDIRSIAKKMYAKLANETNVGLFSLDAYKNMWVKIDLGQYTSMLGIGAPATTSANKETLDEIRNNKLKEMVQNANLFLISSVSTKKIDGVSMAVYSVTLKKENLKQLVIDIATFDNKTLSQKELDAINESLAETKDISGEIAVGKKDGFVHTLNFRMVGVKNEEASVGIVLKDFNKPLQLAEPQNSISVEELIGQFFVGMGANSSLFSSGTTSFEFDQSVSSSIDWEDEQGYDFGGSVKAATDTRSL